MGRRVERRERFTDEVTQGVDKKPDLVVFVLLGAEAQRKKKLIDASARRSARPILRLVRLLQLLRK